jgi:hypothetical protein
MALLLQLVLLVGVVLLAQVHPSIVHAIMHVQNHPHPHLLDWNSKMNLNQNPNLETATETETGVNRDEILQHARSAP